MERWALHQRILARIQCSLDSRKNALNFSQIGISMPFRSKRYGFNLKDPAHFDRLEQCFSFQDQKERLRSNEILGETSLTYAPRPCTTWITFMLASPRSASLTTVVLNPISDASSRCDGRRSPGFNFP